MSIPYPSPVSTLSKFGVSVTGAQGQGPLLQPKLKYRFRVLFLGFGGAGGTAEAISLNTNKCGMPASEHAESEVHSYNSVAYVMGKHKWAPIELEVRDVVDNSVIKALGAQQQIQMDHYNQTGYRAGQNYKFTTIIQILDGNYDTANVGWTLEGCWLNHVKFGDVDYADQAGQIVVGVGIRFDNAILEDLSGYGSIFSIPAADSLGTMLNT